jgi:hypothetical protein
MAGGTRHDVKKSKTPVVLEDLVAWQLAPQDLGEYVVVIVGGHGLLRVAVRGKMYRSR